MQNVNVNKKRGLVSLFGVMRALCKSISPAEGLPSLIESNRSRIEMRGVVVSHHIQQHEHTNPGCGHAS